jgi:hypothetical protein
LKLIEKQDTLQIKEEPLVVVVVAISIFKQILSSGIFNVLFKVVMEAIIDLLKT